VRIEVRPGACEDMDEAFAAAQLIAELLFVSDVERDGDAWVVIY